MKLFNGKCAFCESPIDGLSLGDIDHFRPKMGAKGLSGDLAPDHYWWLVYEWENLYLICEICNRKYKGNRFPVAGKRANPREKGEDLLKEKALLIDPCLDNPDDYLIFSDKGEVAGVDEKGKVTIEVLGLNRSELIGRRRQEINTTRVLISFLLETGASLSDKRVREISEQVLKRIAPSQHYAGAIRQFVRGWLLKHLKKLQGIPAASELLAVVGEWPPPVSTKKAREAVKEHKEWHKDREEHVTLESQLKTQYITRIEIHNFRIFDHLELKFPENQAETVLWMVLLGENGVGKSSILKAVALALMDEGMYREYGLNDASSFLPEGKRVSGGYVRVHMTGFTEPFEVRFKRGDKRFNKPNKNKLQTMVFGYGGTRLPPHAEHKYVEPSGMLRVENLFDPFLPLIEAKSWLRSLNVRDFGYSALAIKDLLP